MQLSERDLVAVLRFEIQQAQGYDADVLATKRQQALDYYQGNMPKPPEGRSGIVSKDVADSLHALMSQLAPILKTTMLDFSPEGEEDEAQAQAETDFVRDAIRKAGGWRTFFSGVHDALLVGNGWLKVEVEEDTNVTREYYPPNPPDEAIYLLSQPTAEDQKVEVRVSKLKTTVKRTTTTRRLSFRCVPPENMLFSEGPDQEDVRTQRFVAERRLYTDAQLYDLGISEEVISRIPYAENSNWPAAMARLGPYQFDSDAQAAQQSQRLREVYCCYILLSSRDSLTTERRYVWIGGSEILKNEPADDVPYLTGSAIPMPHRIQGQGLYDLLASVQAGKTDILRSFVDNLEVMNSGRIGAVEGAVNLNDLTSGRINGVVRIKRPDALVPVPAMDCGPQAMAGLDYLDKVRVSRVGSSVDLNELSAQVMKSSATAAAGQLAQVEQMAGWFAGNLVESLLKPAFMRVHRLLRTELGGPVNAKIRGKWAQTDTSQWRPRTTMDVTMGMTTAQKAQRVGALGQVVTNQFAIISNGGAGVLTDNGKMYNAMCDWMRASDLDTPEQYVIDPESPEAQQAQQNQAAQQQQQQEQMRALQQGLIQMQQAFELEKQRRDLQYKVWSDQLDAEVKEAQMTADNVTKLKVARMPPQVAGGGDDAKS